MPILTARAHPAILCASQSARGAAVYPQIYLGDIPTTSHQRRALRALALDMRARIHATRAADPTTLLLHFRAGESALPAIDLLLLRPSAAIVGAVRAYHGP